VEGFGEFAADAAVVFDVEAGENGLVELPSLPGRGVFVGGLEIGGEVEAARAALQVAPRPEIVTRPRCRNAVAEIRWKSFSITPSGQPPSIQRSKSTCLSLSVLRCAM
jgi:hypothetical protein